MKCLSLSTQALAHPYLAQFHNIDDEPACSHKAEIPIDDNHKYSIEEYRGKLYQDIMKRKKEESKKRKESSSGHRHHHSSSSSKTADKEKEKERKEKEK